MSTVSSFSLTNNGVFSVTIVIHTQHSDGKVDTYTGSICCRNNTQTVKLQNHSIFKEGDSVWLEANVVGGNRMANEKFTFSSKANTNAKYSIKGTPLITKNSLEFKGLENLGESASKTVPTALVEKNSDEKNDTKKYCIDDELMPASESYALAGEVTANITLDNGNVTTTFDDIPVTKTSLCFKISHTYKQGADFGCGKNWQLNLHQTLNKKIDEKNNYSYTYTDGAGNEHSFINTYYYIDKSGSVNFIEQEKVGTDSTGELYFPKDTYKVLTDSTGELSLPKDTYKVFIDQRTSSGMVLSAKLEGIKGGEFFEQRTNEQKQIEEMYNLRIQNLKEYVIFQENDYTIWKELKNFFEKGHLSTQKFEEFIKEANGKLILQKNDALQLLSLHTQQQSYETQIELNDKQKSLYRTTSLELTRQSLWLQHENLYSQFHNLCGTILALGSKDIRDRSPEHFQYTAAYWQAKNIGANFCDTVQKVTDSDSNKSKTSLGKVSLNDPDQKGAINQRDVIDKQIQEIEKQINDVKTQKSIIERSNGSIQEQKNVIEEQIAYITSKNDENLKELEKIFKEYVNYSNLKSTIPVNYLSDGEKTLCFNEDGKLCAFIDSYNNQVFFKYDTNEKISKIYDEKNTIFFNYNSNKQLVSIVDYNGNRVEYTYKKDDGNLQSVKLANGDTISFEYKNNLISKVTSDVNQTASLLTYTTKSQLQSITNYSLATKITDSEISISPDEQAQQNNVLSKVNITYGHHECTIAIDKKTKRLFMDDFGHLIGGISRINDESPNTYSYAYIDRDKKVGFSIHEIDDATISFNGKLNSSYTIKGENLPTTYKEYMFSSLISCTQTAALSSFFNAPHPYLAGTIKHTFYKQTSISTPNKDLLEKIKKDEKETSETFFGIQARVTYTDKTSELFQMPAIPRNEGTQLCALPISLSPLKKVSEITLSFSNTTNIAANLGDCRFAPAEGEHQSFDDLKNLTESESGYNFVFYDNQSKKNRYRRVIDKYDYNEQHLILKKTSTIEDFFGEPQKSITTVTKYSYNDKGSQIREEIYVEGEQANRGSMVNENVYDEKGRLIKNLIYNSLESASKKYSEKAFNGNANVVQYELDDLGERKTSYEYDPMTNEVSLITYPSGSKLAISRDFNTHAITDISQSTEDGEPNSNETHYNCGLVTKLTSGTNTIEYSYNKKREKTNVYFNGKEKAEFKHENCTIPSENINGETFNTESAEKATVTLLGKGNKKTTTESYTDSKGNLLKSVLNGTTLFRNTYSKTKELIKSADYVTGTLIIADYDKQNHRINSITKTKSSNAKFSNLKSVKETFSYDSFGQKTIHSVYLNDKEIQHYDFIYESNAARTLKSIKLPNKFTCTPQMDYLGRNKGKIFSNESGEEILGEYISFKKTGDHSSDLISSIHYGEIQNGTYSISEGLRYKYDANGNISEIWEKGIFLAAYTYDYLNRLIREDNASLKKTWLFSYDRNGNRFTKIEIPFTRQDTKELTNYTNKNIERYSYNGDALTSCNNKKFSYDGNGNPTIFNDENLSWESGKLKAFGNTIFDYDGYGKRIKKNSTIFTYDIDKNLIQMENGNKTLEFIYDNSGLSGIKFNNEQYLLRKNAQGDITHIFNANGQLEVHYVYDAWGNHEVRDANEEIINDSNHIGNINPFRFRGYFYDVETSLYYLINRYYDPKIGRFISQDHISYLQPESINGLNLYTYCGNNPVMRTDEIGCSWTSFWEKVGNFLKKSTLCIAGIAVASIGFATVLAGIGIPFSFGLISGDLGNTIAGVSFQAGMSIGMYGISLIGSAFSNSIYNDMESINWNPFNSNEQKVANSQKISFYKGLSIIRTDGERSGNIGAIFLNKNANIDTIKHEWGHGFQQAILGPMNYLLSVGIPSYGKWGYRNKTDYYDTPWENTAEVIGGAHNRTTTNNKQNAKHLLISYLFGPFSLIYSNDYT